MEGGQEAAVEQLLHEKPFSEQELEELLGSRLEDLFKGNDSQLRSVAFARKNGKSMHQAVLLVAMLNRPSSWEPATCLCKSRDSFGLRSEALNSDL